MSRNENQHEHGATRENRRQRPYPPRLDHFANEHEHDQAVKQSPHAVIARPRSGTMHERADKFASSADILVGPLRRLGDRPSTMARLVVVGDGFEFPLPCAPNESDDDIDGNWQPEYCYDDKGDPRARDMQHRAQCSHDRIADSHRRIVRMSSVQGVQSG